MKSKIFMLIIAFCVFSLIGCNCDNSKKYLVTYQICYPDSVCTYVDSCRHRPVLVSKDGTNGIREIFNESIGGTYGHWVVQTSAPVRIVDVKLK